MQSKVKESKFYIILEQYLEQKKILIKNIISMVLILNILYFKNSI